MYCRYENNNVCNYNTLISKSFKTAGSSLYELLRANVSTNRDLLKDNHFYPKQWREMVDLEKDEVTMIVGIRNPWDYVSSAYWWAKRNNECPADYNFRDFVFKESDFNWQKQLKWWDTDEIDDVIVFEDLENEINRIAISHGIPEIVGKELPWRKKTKNSDIDYREMYDSSNVINYVESVFEDQIKFFNSKFGVSYEF